METVQCWLFWEQGASIGLGPQHQKLLSSSLVSPACGSACALVGCSKWPCPGWLSGKRKMQPHHLGIRGC